MVYFTETDRVYACIIDMEDHLVRKTDGGFDMNEYFTHPQNYNSVFAEKVLS